MTPQAAKRIVCEFTIALMVCGAVHYFVIAPTERRAAEVSRQASELGADQAHAPQLSAQQLRDLATKARLDCQHVREQSRLAEDQTELLTALTRLADELGVRLEQLEPGELKPHSASQAADKGTPSDQSLTTKPTGRMLESSMSISGPYGSVAKFLDSLTREAGYSVVTSTRITPSDVPGAIRARVTAEHHAFVIPWKFAHGVEAQER